MIDVKYLGHSCFQITAGAVRILTDPFLTGNPYAAVTADKVDANYILVSHGHSDHVGDTESIAKRTGATIIGSIDLTGALFKNLNTLPCNIGGRVSLPFGAIKLTPAIHGSGVPGALASGFILSIRDEESAGIEKKIYFAGDTALTKDMELLAEEHLDLAMLPIGDVFTMGAADAARAAKMIGAAMTIPMHYHTFPFIDQDPKLFCNLCQRNGIPVTALDPGDSITV
jgi:L-ascorbate metabolism protein UlaG (beta-lactamase superfamily)